MTLKKQIDDLRREIAQFSAAIELMRIAPAAVDQVATLPDSPLGYLKAMR